MRDVQVYDNKDTLAEAAAKQAIEMLQKAIDEKGGAVWVLAGGSTPLFAYKIIAANYRDALDWSKITLVLGDERIGPLDSDDANWHAIDTILGYLPTAKLRPRSEKSAEDAASDYEQQLSQLPKGSLGQPRFDVMWLGVGVDGHTLSIFPHHDSLLPSSSLVIAVHEAPKPPADRISLTLRALQGASNVMILASGSDKQQAVSDALHGGHSPIALAAGIVDTHEGRVTWLVDRDAAPTD